MRENTALPSPDSAKVDNLIRHDLPHITWAGGPLHGKAVAAALARVPSGEVEYLAVRGNDELPIAVGCIDYGKKPGVGTMWQLATKPELRSKGYGSRLIAEMERRIAARGLKTAELGVEDNNPKARQLYERRGYWFYAHEQQSWPEADEHGKPYTHHAEVSLLRKQLP
jgi:ribosomal protein S18 acetylase RimI-like enzyme